LMAVSVSTAPSVCTECSVWMQRVSRVHSSRTPESMQKARQRVEEARNIEARFRKCKAVKGHAIRSSALAEESLRQLSVSSSAEAPGTVARWRSAQQFSKRRQKAAEAPSMALASVSETERRAEVLSDLDDEEDSAWQHVAQLVGAGQQGLSSAPVNVDGDAPRRSEEPENNGVEAVLAQLKKEPKDEAECHSKFCLYAEYGEEVQNMRTEFVNFIDASQSDVPSAVASDMQKAKKRIDSAEAMGIPDDDGHTWFVYHMMKQAIKNNKNMGSILTQFEQKLEFLRNNAQADCPICLEAFGTEEHIPKTLGCCHKVCNTCWAHWGEVMRGNAFCPLCRHDEFLGEIALRAQG